jgi:hypothetical protein
MSQTRLTFISEALLRGLEVQAWTVLLLGGRSPGAPEIEAPSTKVVRTYTLKLHCATSYYISPNSVCGLLFSFFQA